MTGVSKNSVDKQEGSSLEEEGSRVSVFKKKGQGSSLSSRWSGTEDGVEETNGPEKLGDTVDEGEKSMERPQKAIVICEDFR